MRPLLAAALLVCLAVAASSAAGEIRAAQDSTADSTAGSYIVVFKANAVRAATDARSQRPLIAAAVGELAQAHGGNVTHVYQHALKGFAVRLSPDEAADLAGDPRVAYVEQDRVMHATATQSPATWGLDRIDQRDLPLSNSYTYNQTGPGVHVYIIDTGIRATHQEFGGGWARRRLHRRWTRHERLQRPRHARRRHDRRRPRTAWPRRCASTLCACSTATGSGSNVRRRSRASTGSRPTAIAGRRQHEPGRRREPALDNAVTNSINSGVTYAVAAGNSNANACNFSPARPPPPSPSAPRPAPTPAPRSPTSGRASTSSRPGSSITSAWSTSNTATNTISGTSMAAPHVAGVVALYLQANPGASAAAVASALVTNSTAEQGHEPGQRVSQPAAVLDLRRHAAAAAATAAPSASATSAARR